MFGRFLLKLPHFELSRDVINVELLLKVLGSISYLGHVANSRLKEALAGPVGVLFYVAMVEMALFF